MYSPHVVADMVDANEFMELTRKHRVRGVPKTVINDGASYVEGAVPEEHLVNAIKSAVKN
jgi:predicted DsbA family dithiol-disulfide isomerase